MKDNIKLEDLSKHLFWDVNIKELNLRKNMKQIIHRVLDYGLIDDWLIIQSYYGIREIAEVALTIRDLDKKSASFIALISKIPKEKFLCYTTKPSTQKHWNF
ncbi:MAG: hypothetical protein WC071_13900 [Victivallaceae bacterium]